MTTKKTKKDNTTCKRCGYEWFYKGSLIFVTCPNCAYRFNRNYKKQ